MSYVKFGFILTDSQKEALQNAVQKHTSYTLRLSHSQLSGGDVLNITRTQYNKITNTKSQQWNIDLKLSKSQIAKYGGSISSITAQFAPKILKLAPAMLSTLGLAAASGAISWPTKKATSGDGAKCKRRRKAGTTKKAVSGAHTKQGGFLGTILASLAASLIASALGINGGAGRTGKGLMLPGSVDSGKKRKRRGNL